MKITISHVAFLFGITILIIGGAIVVSFYLEGSPEPEPIEPEEPKGFIIYEKLIENHMSVDVRFYFLDALGNRYEVSTGVYDQYKKGDFFDPEAP